MSAVPSASDAYKKRKSITKKTVALTEQSLNDFQKKKLLKQLKDNPSTEFIHKLVDGKQFKLTDNVSPNKN